MDVLRFSHPQYLLLLPLVWAFIWWTLRDSLADMGRPRARLSGWLRGVLITLLVLALAGVQLVRPTKHLCTVFVVDVSDSIAPAQRDVVLDYIRQATGRMRAGDRAALVAFGGEALLDHAPEERAAITKIVSLPSTTRTDIAAGMQIAMASFPQDTGKHIVLFSDGNENLGNALDQAGLARANDVRISVVPLVRDTARGEVLLLRAEAPSEVKQGTPFQVSVLAESLLDATGTITLYRNADVVETRAVTLKPGKTVIAFEESLPQSGLYHYRALLDVPADQDTVPDNNVAYAYTRVAGKPRALIIEGMRGDGAHLARALRGHDLLVEMGGPDRIPTTLAECAEYETLLFANVPAWRMSPVQMTVIRSAVRDMGMGFAMVGGPESFGAGGYYRTPIEDTLPVSMDAKKQKVLPSLTLVIVIDISGSMTVQEEGVPKIRLAAEAAAAAVELLQPIDYVCVIGFDTRAVYTVPMTKVDNKQRIIDQVLRLESGGGGIMTYSSLQEAYKVIRGAQTQIKHIILCADAQDTEEQDGCTELARQMLNEKITISVIGFGAPTDPHIPFHHELARAGGGNAYLAERLSNLPQIFTRDVMFAAKSLLVEEAFLPHEDDSAHPVMRGIPVASAPPLLGYVVSSMKESPSARQLLATHQEDPLLAVWPYGLGRTLAFTSDATAHWGAHWLRWEGYAPFWAQSLRWTLRRGERGEFQTTLMEERGRAILMVEAITPEGEFRNTLKLRAHVAHVSPGGIDGPQALREMVTLEQTAPGRYEGAFETRRTGTYVVTVEERDGEEVKALQTSTLVIPYSPEYQSLRPNLALLEQIAERAGGAVAPVPRDIFGALRFGSHRQRDLWPALLALMAVLFLLDVAVRRLLMPWEECWGLARDALRARLPVREPAESGAPRDATLDTLLSTKEQSRRPRDEGAGTAALRAMREQMRVEATSPPPAVEDESPPPPDESPAAPPAPTGTVGSLLQKKRERQGK